MTTVPQHRTFDPMLCPVKFWAAVIKRILSYPGTRPNTPINTYMDKRKTPPGHLQDDYLIDYEPLSVTSVKTHLVSRQWKWEPTPSDPVPQWLCTWPESQSTLSCCWPMVKRCLSSIHSKTSSTVQCRHLQPNDRVRRTSSQFPNFASRETHESPDTSKLRCPFQYWP